MDLCSYYSLITCESKLATYLSTACNPLPQDPALESSSQLQRVSIDEILEAQRLQQEKAGEEKRRREQILRVRGMRPLDHTEDTYS